MPIIRIFIFVFIGHLAFGQELDKKAFCASLKEAMTSFQDNHDNLKGAYVGANSYGIRQWTVISLLNGAQSGTYDESAEPQETRVTYVMAGKAKKTESAALYKQLVNAANSCFGGEFSLEEKVSVEHRGGVKVEQLEAEFTRMESGRGTGHQHYYIRISSTAYETGETFEVLVELISMF